MAHFPKPCFKKSRGVWYVEINRKQINLGTDKDEAFRQYHQLMGKPREQVVSNDLLVDLIDAFLDWTHKNRAPIPTSGIGIDCNGLRPPIRRCGSRH